MLKKLLNSTLALLFLSHLGFAQWTSDTTLNTNVRAANGLSIYTPLVSSGSNGSTYFCYFENVGGNYEMHLQLLDSSGNKLWSPNGIAVSTFPQSSAVYRYDMATDNAGDAIIAFQDIRVGGNLNIVAYKVDKTGNLIWGTTGVQLIDSTGTQGLSPKIGVTSNNDVIVAWNASGASSSKWIAFHKITAAGSLAWNSVHRIKVGSNKYSRAVVIPVQGDNFIIQYVQEVGNFPGVTSTMYLDKFNASGASTLSAPVKVSNKTIPFFTFPRPVYDGKDGIYLSFQTSNPSSLSINDTYVQHVSANGTQWSLDGTQAGNSSITHKYPGGPAMYIPLSKETFVILQVQNSSQSSSGIFVQKFDSLGNVLLGNNAKQVLPIVSDMNVPLDCQMTSDGIICFYKNGLFNNEKLRAFKLDFDGNFSWNTHIVSLCGVASNKSNVACGKFDHNQVVLGWLDDRSIPGVYAQNIGNGGTTGVLSNLKSIAQNFSFSLLENPSSELQINFKSDSKRPLNIHVYDMGGRSVFESMLTVSDAVSEYRIPTPKLAPGTYLIKSISGSAAASKLWIKQ